MSHSLKFFIGDCGRSLPIVAYLTSHKRDSDQERCIEAAARVSINDEFCLW
jgi:hypothetical protein